MIDFLVPQALVLLLLVPLYAGLFVVRSAARQNALRQIGDENLVAGLTRGISETGRRFRSAFFLLCTGCMALALARPVAGAEPVIVAPVGAQAILVFDVSLSMDATDAAPSRLARARLDAADIIRSLPGFSFGIVTYAGTALRYMPATTDAQVADLFVASLSTGAITAQGTNLPQALLIAADMLDDQQSTPSTLMLFSDGENHEGDLEAALAALRERDIRVIALGYGTAAGSTIPVADPITGEPALKTDPATGTLVVSQLREDVLRRVADATDGRYAAPQTSLDLLPILEILQTSAAQALSPQVILRPIERADAFVVLAFAFFALSVVWPEGKTQ
jgi:Ca-activated chloride channel family protein